MSAHLLLVDDEPSFQELAASWLTGLGYVVTVAADAEQAQQRFEQQLAQAGFDLVLLDLALPPYFDPRKTLTELLPLFHSTPVIVLTGHAEQRLAIEAIGLGAEDFLGKPIDPPMLKIVLERCLERARLRQQVSQLQQELAGQQTIQADHLGLLGSSPAMEQLRSLVRRMAPSDLPVLIGGASGTGKELVAQALHSLSSRKSGPLVAVHCGAIPAELIESELFGYVKGAFTGADRDRPGLIASAAGGTLFLDELGEMPAAMQVKLLRVLQGGDYYPVGSRQAQQADVRVVAATHKDLQQAVAAGEFREDLYYRLRGLQLQCPSLAERPQDIPLLARHFAQSGGGRHLDEASIQWLVQREWPGNVRELKHAIESAAALCAANSPIEIADLQLCCGEVVSVDGSSDLTADASAGLDAQLQFLEKRLIVAALDHCDGNHTHAAKYLAISRVGLLKKMSRFGLR